MKKNSACYRVFPASRNVYYPDAKISFQPGWLIYPQGTPQHMPSGRAEQLTLFLNV